MHYRSIFISDIHLGARISKVDELFDFLTKNTCETLYLIGDIIDFWKINRSCYFPSSHVRLVQLILDLSEKGTKVFYVAGNHDEIFRQYIPLKFGNIKMCDEMIHEMPDGRRLLIIHGDQFDQIMLKAKWLMKLGDISYSALICANAVVHKVRNALGYEYWSLSKWLKSTAKGAVKFISKFGEMVAEAVKSRGLDGVVCGHIHHPEIKMMNGVLYINCGDWCETCSAITETHKGDLTLHHYHNKVH